MTSCPVCCNHHIKEIDHKLFIFRCESCTHLFSITKVREQEVYAETYYLKEHENWFRHPNYKYFSQILNQIHAHTTLPLTLLDVGCGKGDFLKYVGAHDTTAHLSGIDITKNSHPQIQFIQGNIMTYNFRQTYSVITAFMVIEHVNALIAFVQKLHTLLKPEGTLFISTINNESLMYTLARMLRWFGVRDAFERLYSHHHVQHFSPQSLHHVLEQQGFTISSHKNHNYPLNAVDVPKRNWLITKMYLLTVRMIFFISAPLGLGMHQTIVCKRSKSVIPVKR